MKRRLIVAVLATAFLFIGFRWDWWLALIRLPVATGGAVETSSVG